MDQMMAKVSPLNVAIVGGGPGCKAIMDMIFAEKLSQLRMRLVGVACTNPNGPGYRYAQEKGVYTTRDYRDLYKLKDLDMIIELTGRLKIANQISLTKPERVQLMGHVAARLFWDVFQIEEHRIAERHLAAEALRESATRSRLVLQTVPSGLFTVDVNMNITSWNKAAKEITGLRPEDVLGKNCLEALDCDECKYGCALFDDTVDKPIFGAECVIHVEGRSINISKNADSLLNMQGQVIGGLESFVDITQQKKAEEALRESEARYRDLYENAPNAYCSVSATDGSILGCNGAALRLLGYDRETMMGMRVLDLYADTSHGLAKANEVFRRLEAGESIRNTELQMKHKDGNPVWISLSAEPVRDSEGKIIMYRSMASDVSERKGLEAQFQQAQKLEAVATVAGGIAHNFNNLLMGIQGNISLMLHQIDSAHPLYERLSRIEKQVDSGANLTRHLLGYARKGKYEVKPIDLNQLIMDTSDTFGTTKKEIRIHRELDKRLYTIKGDKGQIEQVLWNLYVNASDAMPGGGNLILQTVNTTHNAMKGKPYEVKPGPYILLTIRDTGIGMNEETIERIFEPFFTTKEMGRGTGLGLASAYGIIRAHDGHIEVESEKRRGTTFRIFLPASDTMVQDTIKAHEQVLEGTETVLLVDDEEPVLEVGRDLLKAMGYRVLIARDGREAVRVYRKNKRIVDIVILDIVMPTMGGGVTYDLLKQINQDVKVLLSSGYSINGEATDILERGCNGFIQKPFSMKELSGAIRKVLQKE
jgi:two-component system cell cycle sensor histidine kinase/response regulator CckA